MKLSQFQTVFLIIFVMLGVLGVLVFAGIINIGKDNQKASLAGKVSLWGTVPADTMRPIIDEFNYVNQDLQVVYTAHEAEDFNQNLLESLAEGKGPDMFLLSDDLSKSYINRLMAISYARYPAANFKSNFATASDIFTTPNAILALPLTIDPLMLYYNQSILNTNSIVYPPNDWDSFLEITSKITKKDDNNQINQSAVALGHFTNIESAKAIITTFFLQTGNPIVVRDPSGIYKSTLSSETFNKNSLVSALTYYTSFANPLNSNYSWHKGLPNSKDYFIAENSAFYFGYASELKDLVKKNPNMDLKIAEIPQIKNSNIKTTKARVTGVAISSFSKKQELSLAVANLMTSGNFIRDFAKATGTAPARRDLLATQLADAYMPIVFKSALYSKSWSDPSPKDTDNIFRVMVESVLSNVNRPESAITRASGQLDILLAR